MYKININMQTFLPRNPPIKKYRTKRVSLLKIGSRDETLKQKVYTPSTIVKILLDESSTCLRAD
jgi:hypothetical protein